MSPVEIEADSSNPDLPGPARLSVDCCSIGLIRLGVHAPGVALQLALSSWDADRLAKQLASCARLSREITSHV